MKVILTIFLLYIFMFILSLHHSFSLKTKHMALKITLFHPRKAAISLVSCQRMIIVATNDQYVTTDKITYGMRRWYKSSQLGFWMMSNYYTLFVSVRGAGGLWGQMNIKNGCTSIYSFGLCSGEHDIICFLRV